MNVSFLACFVCFAAWSDRVLVVLWDQNKLPLFSSTSLTMERPPSHNISQTPLHILCLTQCFYSRISSNISGIFWKKRGENMQQTLWVTFRDVRCSVLFHLGALRPRCGCWWAVGNSHRFCWVQDGVIFIIHLQWCIDILLFLSILSFLLFLCICSDGCP